MGTATLSEPLAVTAQPEPVPPRDHLGALPARHRRVASLLTRLATTARSFILYDIRNDTVRRSLHTLLDAFAETLAVEPVLRLDVLPFEIHFQAVRVYLDRDRERSLAFRLYRDGVRALVVREGFDGTELARLLEILSVRYTGVHQHEDDSVTLLWRAGLRFLDVIAVEGLAPETGNSDDWGCAQASEPRVYLPEDVDLPRVAWTGESPPEWIEVGAAELEALREEAATGTLASDALAVIAELRAALDDPEEKMRFAEAAHLMEEIRDFLLSVDSLPALVALVRELQRVALSDVEWDPDRHAAAVGILTSCGSDRAVRRLVHSVPAEERLVRPEMIELLDLVCPDPFTAVAEALAAEDRPSGRAVARQLLEHYGSRRGSHLRQFFDSAHGRAAADLLRALAGLEGEAPAAFLARQCAHPDPEVREEALWHLERAPFTPALGAALVQAIRHSGGEERRRLLALVERSHDRRFVAPLFSLVHSGLRDADEATDVARVIGRLEGASALERWQPWLRPQGRFLRRRLWGSPLQQAAAAAAVAQVPGERASHLLRMALSAARGEVRDRIENLLEQRDPAPAAEAS